MDLNFDKLYKYTLLSLKISGAHPAREKDLIWALQFTVMHGLYTLVAIIISYSLIYHDFRKGIVIVCGNSSWVIVYFVITFFYLILLIYRQSFMILINTVSRDYLMARENPLVEQKLLTDFVKRSKFAVNFWVVITVSCGIVFFFKPMIIMLYSAYRNEFRLVPIEDFTFPPPFQNDDSILCFIVAFILSTYFEFYTTIMYIGVVPLGLIFMLHACCRLELLRVRVMQLFPRDESVTLQERSESLKAIALYLQDTYDFVDRIKTTFKLMYELTMKGTTIILPVLGYVCVETYKEGNFDIAFLILLCGALALSGWPSYCGDLLQEKGNDLREAVYMSGWECVWERRTRTSLLMLMTRMERTIAIRSLFRVICLDSLTDVYRQAFSLFNLLNAAYNCTYLLLVFSVT